MSPETSRRIDSAIFVASVVTLLFLFGPQAVDLARPVLTRQDSVAVALSGQEARLATVQSMLRRDSATVVNSRGPTTDSVWAASDRTAHEFATRDSMTAVVNASRVEAEIRRRSR